MSMSTMVLQAAMGLGFQASKTQVSDTGTSGSECMHKPATLNGFRSIFGGWNGSLQRPWIAPETGIRNAGLPDNVYAASCPPGVSYQDGGGWRYVRGMSYARSISPENTRLVSLVGQIYPLHWLVGPR